MLFTEGKAQEYERMMQQKPGFHRGKREIRFPTAKHRDCPHCLYYDVALQKCGLEKCSVFKE